MSNDNPYSESIFKTLKYRPNYQPKGFETVEEARKWCSVFVHWYRYDHHHSGIKFLIPAERHKGKSEEILANRTKVYETAKAAHPERWNGRQTRNWSNIEKSSPKFGVNCLRYNVYHILPFVVAWERERSQGTVE